MTRTKPKGENPKFTTTSHPLIVWEDTEVGRLKKKIFEASMPEIDAILKDFGVPSPSELGKGGCYIQSTPRARQIEKRRKNDVVIIPVGTTENHGAHSNTGLDNFMVTQIAEGVRRYTAKKGREVNIAAPPLNYGGHPYHHIGMPGTIQLPQEVVVETLIYVMLGLWNDGYRKQIIINNHGQLWMLETALHEFCKRFQLPGIYQVMDWHRAIREFFIPVDRPDSLETTFIHADESETAVGLLLFPDMMDMSVVKDERGRSFLPGGHFDTSVDPWRRPHRWSEGEGHFAIERAGTPGGVVGEPSLATAEKAKRPIAAILSYLTLCVDQILDAYPSGKLPPIEDITLRDPKQLEPFLKEPYAPGWKSVFELPAIGPFTKG
ncbi:MAG: 3-dehydro-scyllo-inosose hydrolase [Opitutaceae bacterium]|jgi:creatinine amidohydrolase